VLADKTAKKPRGRPFQPGNRANPHGRPSGSRNVAIKILDAVGDESAADILNAVVKRARRGDMTAAGIILRRAWPEPKGRRIVVDLPAVTSAEGVYAAIAAVVAAAARGELTAEEGAAFVSLIEAQRRAIETAELEARLLAIEARVGTDEQEPSAPACRSGTAGEPGNAGNHRGSN
jgi:hypothetical protein